MNLPLEWMNAVWEEEHADTEMLILPWPSFATDENVIYFQIVLYFDVLFNPSAINMSFNNKRPTLKSMTFQHLKIITVEKKHNES